MSQQKQIDFLQILARPLLFNYPDFNKPNYHTQPYCDRCRQNLSNFYSSNATPNTDLCPTCFKILKSDDQPPPICISGPINVQQHTFPGFVPSSTLQPQTMMGARSQSYFIENGPSGAEK